MSVSDDVRDLETELAEAMDRVGELEDRVAELEESEKLLNALQAGGVDNWDGYDFACEDAGI